MRSKWRETSQPARCRTIRLRGGIWSHGYRRRPADAQGGRRCSRGASPRTDRASRRHRAARRLRSGRRRTRRLQRLAGPARRRLARVRPAGTPDPREHLAAARTLRPLPATRADPRPTRQATSSRGTPINAEGHRVDVSAIRDVGTGNGRVIYDTSRTDTSASCCASRRGLRESWLRVESAWSAAGRTSGNRRRRRDLRKSAARMSQTSRRSRLPSPGLPPGQTVDVSITRPNGTSATVKVKLGEQAGS